MREEGVLLLLPGATRRALGSNWGSVGLRIVVRCSCRSHLHALAGRALEEQRRARGLRGLPLTVGTFDTFRIGGGIRTYHRLRGRRLRQRRLGLEDRRTQITGERRAENRWRLDGLERHLRIVGRQLLESFRM